jgi:hypothetical protein
MAISILTSILFPRIIGLGVVVACAQSALGVALRMMTNVGRTSIQTPYDLSLFIYQFVPPTWLFSGA